MPAAAAVVGTAVVGGIISYGAAGKAADAQQDAAKKGRDTTMQMYQQNREDLTPWREAGAWALGKSSIPAAENVENLTQERNQLMQLLEPPAPAPRAQQQQPSVDQIRQERMGYNPNNNSQWATNIAPSLGPTWQPPENSAEIQNKIALLNQQIEAGGQEVPGTGLTGMIERGPGEFQESPSYQFAKSEGLKGQQNAMTAMGRNRSGAHVKAGTQYAENIASGEYDNWLRRYYESLNPLQSLSGVGQTAANQTAGYGANAANQMSNMAMYSGNAQGGGYINQANALTGAMQGGTNQLLYLNAMKKYGG